MNGPQVLSLPIWQQALGPGPRNTIVTTKEGCRASWPKPIKAWRPESRIGFGFWTPSHSFSGSWVLCCNCYRIKLKPEQRALVLKPKWIEPQCSFPTEHFSHQEIIQEYYVCSNLFLSLFFLVEIGFETWLRITDYTGNQPGQGEHDLGFN